MRGYTIVQYVLVDLFLAPLIPNLHDDPFPSKAHDLKDRTSGFKFQKLVRYTVSHLDRGKYLLSTCMLWPSGLDTSVLLKVFGSKEDACGNLFS
jgi:hypothetical protein